MANDRKEMESTMLPKENRRILNEAKNTCRELIEEYKMFEGFKRDAIIGGAQEVIQGIEEIIRLFDVNPEIEALEIEIIQKKLEDQFKTNHENDIPLSERITLNIEDILSNKGIFVETIWPSNIYNTSIYIDDLSDTLDSAKKIGLKEFVYWKYKYDDIIKHSELAIKCLNAIKEGKDVDQVIKDYTGYDEEMNIFHFTDDFKLDWEFDANIHEGNDINKYFITVSINDIRRNAAILINYKNRHVEFDNYSSLYKYLYELLESVRFAEKNNSDSFEFDKVKYAYIVSRGLRQLTSLANEAYRKKDFDASLSYFLAYERVIEHMHSLGYNHRQINDISHLYSLYRICMINNDSDNAKSTVEKVISRSKSYRYHRETQFMDRILNSWKYLNPEQFTVTNINGRHVNAPLDIREKDIRDSIQKELFYLLYNPEKDNIQKANKLNKKLSSMSLHEYDVPEIIEYQIVLGKYQLAISNLERCISFGWQSKFIYELLIYSYLKMDNYEAIKSVMKEALDVLASDYEYEKEQALLLAKKYGKYDAIIEKIEQSKPVTFYDCTGIENCCSGIILISYHKYLDDWKKKLKRLMEKNILSFPCPSNIKRLI